MNNFEMIVRTVKQSLDKYLEKLYDEFHDVVKDFKKAKFYILTQKEYTEKIYDMLYHQCLDNGEEYNEDELKKSVYNSQLICEPDRPYKLYAMQTDSVFYYKNNKAHLYDTIFVLRYEVLEYQIFHRLLNNREFNIDDLIFILKISLRHEFGHYIVNNTKWNGMSKEEYSNTRDEISKQLEIVERISFSLVDDNKIDEADRIYFVLNPNELAANNAVGLTPDDMIKY